MPFTDYHFSPTSITKTSPVRATYVSHGLTPGMRVRATNFVTTPSPVATGMEQINNGEFVVQNVDADSFDLYYVEGGPVDGTNFTEYNSNGLGVFTVVGPELYYENDPD